MTARDCQGILVITQAYENEIVSGNEKGNRNRFVHLPDDRAAGGLSSPGGFARRADGRCLINDK